MIKKGRGWIWARVIENIYAADRALELAKDPEVTSPKVRTIPTKKPGEGIGIIEAPRGYSYPSLLVG